MLGMDIVIMQMVIAMKENGKMEVVMAEGIASMLQVIITKEIGQMI